MGLRSPVSQKPFQAKSATSMVARGPVVSADYGCVNRHGAHLTVPAVLYSACETSSCSIGSMCGVVPVAVIVPVFPCVVLR